MKFITLLMLILLVGFELATSSYSNLDAKSKKDIEDTNNFLDSERQNIYGDSTLLPAISKPIERTNYFNQIKTKVLDFVGIKTKTEEIATTTMSTKPIIDLKNSSSTPRPDEEEEDTIATDIEEDTTTVRFGVRSRN
ncbi:unnamed protein product [Chironomus riparius]|uniref:Uncharacterized protein n=1 Tax=Chironomus riparius TaxID=315576 RepID=A0A9N9S409_9DIPT|nr:unnamed protein product [Chironomus riparius]